MAKIPSYIYNKLQIKKNKMLKYLQWWLMKNSMCSNKTEKNNFFNKIILISLFVIGIFGINSCEDEPVAPQYGNVTGLVLDAKTGEPIKSAMIYTEPGSQSVVTNETGTFTLTGIDPGLYTIRAIKSQYKTSYTNIKVIENKTTNASILMFMGEGNINLDSLDENRAPTKPVATKPKNDSKISTEYVELNWVCQDPDEDEVTYNVYFDKTSVGQKLLINNLKTPKYLVSDLEKLTTYYWKVEAIDEYGNKTMSNGFSFYVDTVATIDNGNPKIEDGLLTYISFDNEITSSNSNYTALVYNVNLTNDRNGNSNSAGSFLHYSQNSVQITDLPYSISSYTISFWVNPESHYGYPYGNEIHLAGRYGYTQNGSMKISYESGKLLYKHNNNGNSTVNTNQNLNTNTWTHITLTFNAQTYIGNFYINGEKKHSTTFSYLPNSATANFSIGMDALNGNRVFNGKIDEFYLFNRAITENEVLKLYGN